MSRITGSDAKGLMDAYSAVYAPQELTEEQMGWLHKCTNGSWIFNQSTRSVDINGDFSCGGQGLTHFKGVIFGEVDGDFDCDNNNLSSLEGAPRYVDGGFYCGKNKLTSLAGAPEEVGRDFDCSYNNLTNLTGAPRSVAGNFYCEYNRITNMNGLPRMIGGNTYSKGNPIDMQGLNYFIYADKGDAETITNDEYLKSP